MTEINPIGNRIHVVGTTGSGKTYTAKKISEVLGIEHIELDAIHWGPNWSKPSSSEFRGKVKEALREQAWVENGNYGQGRDIIWRQLDTLVWLDYSLLSIMSQLIRRTLKRSFTWELLWS
ncbi:MAG: hypothetical protein FVQ83_05015 [Chloroflexi bacterium]|nr:hypothetical protein [Chloroflexota bacterium]